MSLRESTTHAVVLFTDKGPNQKKLVDLVPRSWLYKEGRHWLTLYPDETEYEKVDDYVKVSKTPKRTWKGSAVQLLKEADYYAQGLRRLQKSYKTSNIESSTANERSNESSSFDSESGERTRRKRASTTLSQKKSFTDIPSFPRDQVSALNSPDRNEVSSTSEDSRPPKRSRPDLYEKINCGTPTISLDTDQTRRKLQLKTLSISRHLSHTSHRRKELQQKAKEDDEHHRDKDIINGITKGFITVEARILKKLDNMKRSLLYDIEKKFEGIQNTLTLGSTDKTAEDLSKRIWK